MITTTFVVDQGDIALNVSEMIIPGRVVLLAEALEGVSEIVRVPRQSVFAAYHQHSMPDLQPGFSDAAGRVA
jgi:hypothetical protein